MKHIERNAIIIAILVAIDQTLKHLVENYKPMLDFFLFTIHLVYNTGASFGILQNSNTLLMIVSIIALILIIWNIKIIRGEYELPVSLVTAGIIGNLIDRIFLGHVIDFFDLGWFPVFNLADSCIVIGAIWLCIMLLIEERKENSAKLRSTSNRK